MKKTQDEIINEDKEEGLRIKKILDTPAGQDLKHYFLQQIVLLRNVNNVQEYSTATATAAALKAHKMICTMFERMMTQIMTWSEQEIQEVEKENDYGVE